MLIALSRRRSLLAAVTVLAALAGFAAPALAGAHGICLDAGDQHCPPSLPAAVPLRAPAPLGLISPSEVLVTPTLIVHPLLKVPLAS